MCAKALKIWASGSHVLHRRHNERDAISNTSLKIVYSTVYLGTVRFRFFIVSLLGQRPHTSVHSTKAQLKENIKFRVTRLCTGNSPVSGRFVTQWASNARKRFSFDGAIMISLRTDKIAMTRQNKNVRILQEIIYCYLSFPRLRRTRISRTVWHTITFNY